MELTHWIEQRVEILIEEKNQKILHGSGTFSDQQVLYDAFLRQAVDEIYRSQTIRTMDDRIKTNYDSIDHLALKLCFISIAGTIMAKYPQLSRYLDKKIAEANDVVLPPVKVPEVIKQMRTKELLEEARYGFRDNSRP